MYAGMDEISKKQIYVTFLSSGVEDILGPF